MASRKQIVKDLIDQYGRACFYCRRALLYWEITLDHYIPKAAGGSDELSNLRPSCFDCNNAKADRVPLPDGSLPPKSSPKIRAVPKGQRPEVCRNCQSGRLLQAGESCPVCQTLAGPPIRPWYLKKHALSCDHVQFWCSACCLWLAQERRLSVLTAHPES